MTRYAKKMCEALKCNQPPNFFSLFSMHLSIKFISATIQTYYAYCQKKVLKVHELKLVNTKTILKAKCAICEHAMISEY